MTAKNEQVLAEQANQNVTETVAKLLTDNQRAIALPPNYSLVSTEKFRPNRFVRRGKYSAVNLKCYCNYLDDHAGGDDDKAHVFIDDQNTAVAFFDFNGGLGHCADIAVYSPQYTPEYRAFHKLNEIKSAEKLRDYLEDWAYLNALTVRNIKGDMITVQEAAQALRDITVDTAKQISLVTGELDSKLTASERVSLKAKENFPSEIHLETAMYEGTEETVTAVVKVRTDISGNNLSLALREITYRQNAQIKRNEIQSEIRAVGLAVTFGTFDPS